MDTPGGSGREGTAGLGSCLGLPQTLTVPLVLRHALTRIPHHSPSPCSFSTILPGLQTSASLSDRGSLIPLLWTLTLQWALNVRGASPAVIPSTHRVKEAKTFCCSSGSATQNISLVQNNSIVPTGGQGHQLGQSAHRLRARYHDHPVSTEEETEAGSDRLSDVPKVTSWSAVELKLEFRSSRIAPY